MKRFVGFGPESEARLRALFPRVEPRLRAIADAFYARLQENVEARRVFAGPAQIEKLKQSLQVWLRSVLLGPWDEAYADSHSQIGRVHVRLGVPQRFLIGAMNMVRAALVEAGCDEGDQRACLETVAAVDKILDLELTLMLESYREAVLERAIDVERLERSSLARRLAISEARYEEIVEKGQALVTTFDSSGAILLMNRRCEEILGLDRREALGRSFREVFVQSVEDGGEAAAEEALRRSGGTALEARVLRSDGSPRWVRWHFTSLPGHPEPIRCAIGLDVTEERLLHERSRRAEHLAALGTLSAGLAHEIRNPLNAASLQLTLVERRLQRQPMDVAGALAAANLVRAEMQRLAGLVDEYLQFARPQPLRRQRIDLRETARHVVSLLGPEAASRDVRLDLEDGPPLLLLGEEERLRQVMVNLVRNAVEAVGERGEVALALWRDGDRACFSVADNGPGLPAPDAPIFEPFFTTKPGGTGLGLSIVHRIVGDHGGKVGVDSRPGATTFTVELPCPE